MSRRCHQKHCSAPVCFTSISSLYYYKSSIWIAFCCFCKVIFCFSSESHRMSSSRAGEWASLRYRDAASSDLFCCINGFSSWYLFLDTVKVYPVLSGETFKADKTLLGYVTTRRLKVKHESLKKSKIVILFCPVTSRVGSDVEAAMKNLPGNFDLTVCSDRYNLWNIHVRFQLTNITANVQKSDFQKFTF